MFARVIWLHTDWGAGGQGAFTAILPKATCANYYITSHLIGPHDVAMNTACLINNIKLSLREQGDMKINALLPIGVNALGG